MKLVEWNKEIETEDCPKMMEVYLEQAWQDAFCYALAVEPAEKDYHDHKLLLAIVAGNDSTLQAMKAAIDIGSNGLYFGHGVKELTEYRFQREFQMAAEKGKYEKFSITINANRKAVAIVHDSLLGNDQYILSFEGDPAEDIRRILGGGKYGLHILPEWKHTVYRELLKRGYLEEVEFYADQSLFPMGFHIFKLNLEEEQADNLISELIKRRDIVFPNSGTGKNLEEVHDLTTYMQTFVDDMVKKISAEVNPLHNPLTDPIHPQIHSYKRELFPVQAHVSSSVAKALRKNKAVIIQGEMSTGKTTMMTATTDVLASMSQKQGYFACLMVPPSLTKKWPEEIREIIPDATVHVIEKTEQLIQFHANWTKQGRTKPTKPTFFVVSFTTMRGDASIKPAVTFTYKKTTMQKENNRLPYKYGYYCPSCGKAHQVIEDTRTEINENNEEVEVQVKKTMDQDEFGNTRRLTNTKLPANAFCSECHESLWTKSVPTRYSSFLEWTSYEKKLFHALSDGNTRLAKQLHNTQPDLPKKQGKPRRIATIEYIRRKMKNFFDIAIIDEIHELKAGLSAQGNALGSLVSASKKVVGGTGTLFGGKAEDVYYSAPRFSINLVTDEMRGFA